MGSFSTKNIQTLGSRNSICWCLVFLSPSFQTMFQAATPSPACGVFECPADAALVETSSGWKCRQIGIDGALSNPKSIDLTSAIEGGRNWYAAPVSMTVADQLRLPGVTETSTWVITVIVVAVLLIAVYFLGHFMGKKAGKDKQSRLQSKAPGTLKYHASPRVLSRSSPVM